MRRDRGVSMLELLVVAAMGAIVVAGVSRAFSAGVDFQTKVVPLREDQLDRQRFEDGIARLIRSAYITEDEQDATTYFVASNSTGGVTLTESASADTLIFTILGTPPPASFLNSTEDFETRNQIFGPQGGAAEIQLGTTPVGDTVEHSGLFLREQRPSDGEPLQGGYERVYEERVNSIFFEFWNGETWTGEWDTILQGERRLPAAVRVTYDFVGEEQSRSFVVRIPLSDVTAENPLGFGGATP